MSFPSNIETKAGPYELVNDCGNFAVYKDITGREWLIPDYGIQPIPDHFRSHK